jgi:hypothetical protein
MIIFNSRDHSLRDLSCKSKLLLKYVSKQVPYSSCLSIASFMSRDNRCCRLRDPSHRRARDLDLTLVQSGMMATVLEMMLAYNVRFGPWRNDLFLVFVFEDIAELKIWFWILFLCFTVIHDMVWANHCWELFGICLSVSL